MVNYEIIIKFAIELGKITYTCKKADDFIVTTIQQLSYIVKISEAGSINKASEILYIAQPSLTSSVQDVEKELGFKIFHRSGRGVSLTPEGAEFVLYARQVLNQYELLTNRARSLPPLSAA